MTKAIPSIEKYMTTSPHSVGPDQPLSLAHRTMHEHHIRHLPVLEGGRLIGMVTERDVALIMGMKNVDETRTTVEDAMSTSVYSVSPEAPLDEVATSMAEHKYGSAVVLAGTRVVGVFTTVDACRALAELLRGRLAK